MISSKFFINNRRRLANLITTQGEPIIIAAHSLLQRSGDTVYPFRQDSNFFYLTGIEEPDIVLVIQGGIEFLILPKKSYAEITFNSQIDCDEIAKKSGIITIYSHAEGWSQYKKLQQNRKKIHTILPAAAKVTHTDSFFTNPARRHLLQKLRRINPAAKFNDIRGQLTQLRMIKQPEEVAVIQQAINITKIGIESAKSAISEGIAEYELAEILAHEFRMRGFDHAFRPIVSAGENTCILHYTASHGTVAMGNFLLLDVGAEVQNYAADISRTYSLGITSERQAAVFEAVKEAQQQSMRLLKPGLTWKDWSQQVDQIMGEKLIALDLIKDINRDQVRKYFPHGIGHSLGLDVHDVCDYQTIHKNMVMTVEPGIYIAEEGIGVRVEDDVLITEHGAVNLSENIP